MGRPSNSPPPELLNRRLDFSQINVNSPVVPDGRHDRASATERSLLESEQWVEGFTGKKSEGTAKDAEKKEKR